MLHLQPGIDLEKIEILGGVVVDELDRARRLVADRLAKLNRRLQKLLPDGALEPRGGRLFDDLLVPPLYRAIALAESGNRAAAVTEDLNLDVPGLGNESFQVQCAASKVRLAQAPDRIESFVQLRGRSAQPDADATSARRAFQHEWISDAAGGFDHCVDVFEQSAARQQRHAIFGCDPARYVFQTEVAHLLRRRPDEHDPVRQAGFREFRVFAEKSVTRVDGLRARFPRGLQQDRYREIALRGWRRSDERGFVSLVHVRRMPVGLRINGHRSDAHPAQRPDDAARNRSTVGDQDLAKHHAPTSSQISTWTG